MTDILLDFLNDDTNSSEWDFVFDTTINDLETTNNLLNSVIVSLFTNKRASDEDSLPVPEIKYGWWGDQILPAEDGDQIGSKLWLLDRSSTTENVEVKAKEYIEEALAWMIDDDVAEKIEVQVERIGTPGNDILAYDVKIYQTDGNLTALKYSDKWEAQIGI